MSGNCLVQAVRDGVTRNLAGARVFKRLTPPLKTYFTKCGFTHDCRNTIEFTVERIKPHQGIAEASGCEQSSQVAVTVIRSHKRGYRGRVARFFHALVKPGASCNRAHSVDGQECSRDSAPLTQ